MFVNRIVLGVLAFICLTACDHSAPTAVSSTATAIGSNSPPMAGLSPTMSTLPLDTGSTGATTSTSPTPTSAVTVTLPAETPAEATPAPRPLFGLFDAEQTFATRADINAAVAALRVRYSAVAAIPIAVPTDAPADTTVRFVGTLSWDGQPSILTIVDVGGTQVFEASALPAVFVACAPSPDAHWRTVTIRGDNHGCVSVSSPGGSEHGQWHEAPGAWWYSAEPTAVSTNAWLSGLRIISPMDTPFSLYTHCGVNGAMINHIWWEAIPVLADGNGNPPPTWGNPSQSGTLHYTSDSNAMFTATSTTGAILTVTLHCTTSTEYPLNCS